MATIGSLDIGDQVYDPLSYNGTDQGGSKGIQHPYDCVIWTVIGKNVDGNNTVTLFGDYRRFNYFDAAEPTNPNTDIQTKGYSRYSLSNIFQQLNSNAAKNWFTKKHTYDEVNSSSNNTAGYLYSLSDDLKNQLQTFSKPVAKPTSDGGGIENVSAKVHLLSENEITGEGLSTEGNRYPGFQLANPPGMTNSGIATRSAKNTNGTISNTEFVNRIQISSGNIYKSTDIANTYSVYSKPIVVVPNTLKISDKEYRQLPVSDTSGTVRAFLHMPIAIEIDDTGTNYSKAYASTTIWYRIYDESYNISNFTIKKGSEVVYETTNITKGTQYEYNPHTEEWALNESHTYTFTATNTNGDTISVQRTYKRVNAQPTVKIRNHDEGVYNPFVRYGDLSKAPTLDFEIWDYDSDVEENIYLYVTTSSNLQTSSNPVLIGTYSRTGYFNYDTITIPKSVWQSVVVSGYSQEEILYFYVTNTEFDGTPQYSLNSAYIYFNKVTPAPYVTVDSTNIGRKNVGFTVKYTPNIDTEQDITKVEIYIDNVLKSTVNTPVPGNQLEYEITKAALYDLTLGTHTISFKIYDDLNQMGTTNVTFTRYNDAPNVIATTSLGDKNLGFTSEFSVSDTETDTMNVRVYIDSTSSTPILSQDDVATGSRLTYEVTKAQLYTLSKAQHSIIIVVSDVYDSTTVTATFTRVNSKPVITASQETSVHYENFDVTYSVTDAEDDATDLLFKVGNVTLASLTNVELNTQHTQNIDISSLGYGAKVLSITATDSQGETSTINLNFTISSKPVIYASEINKISAPYNGTYRVDDPDNNNLYTTATLDGETVLVELNNAPHNQDITYSITEQIFDSLSLGEHYIDLYVRDTDNNVITKRLNFTVASLPTIEITPPLPSNITKPLTLNVAVDDVDGDEVTVKAFIDNTEIPIVKED